MRVICPGCGYDAGDVEGVEVGCSMECECGHKWCYELSKRQQTGEKDLLEKAVAAGGSFIASRFSKAKKGVARRSFKKKLPETFLKAAEDGVFSDDEIREFKAEIKNHGMTWAEAIEEVQPLTKDFADRVFDDMISDGVLTDSEQRELLKYIEMFDLKDHVKPKAESFIRRVLAEAVSDKVVTDVEREEIYTYTRLFDLQHMLAEVEAVIGRVERIWKLNNNIIPKPIAAKHVWLKSDEALYYQSQATYYKQLKSSTKEIVGELFITNTRFEFIAPNFSSSHTHDQLRSATAGRRTLLSLMFHPRTGSGTYVVQDAPLVCAFLNCMARASNRTVSISREDSTVDQRRRISKETKHDVWLRDGGQCVECGAEDYIEFDHIIPVTKGGSNTSNNIQLLCRRCNGRKSNKI